MEPTYESFEERAPNGVLSPEQGAQLLAEMFGGGAKDVLPSAGKPAESSAAAVQEPEKPVEAAADEKPKATDEGAAQAPKEGKEPDGLTDENAVVLGKNGKYHIPYSSLEKSRAEAKQLEQLNAELQRKLEALTQQAQERSDQGQAPTKVDNMANAAQAAIEQGVSPDIFGDFSPEALAKGIAQLVASQIGNFEQRMQANVELKLQPVLHRQQTSEADAHSSAILQAHPDVASVVESVELKNWIDSKPGYARGAIVQVLEGGSAAQVIEVLNDFKADTNKAQAQPSQPGTELSREQVEAKAKEAASKVETQRAPASLSDIPGGTANAISVEEAFKSKSPMGMVEDLMRKSPEEIDQFLRRVV